MANKKTARKRAPGAILSVAPITSRETIGATARHLTMLRPLMRRYRVLQRYVLELAELRAAIKALGGNPDE